MGFGLTPKKYIDASYQRMVFLFTLVYGGPINDTTEFFIPKTEFFIREIEVRLTCRLALLATLLLCGAIYFSLMFYSFHALR